MSTEDTTAPAELAEDQALEGSDTVETEEFYNAFHNPKNGRFTFKGSKGRSARKGAPALYVGYSAKHAASYKAAGRRRALANKKAKLKSATMDKIYGRMDQSDAAAAKRSKAVGKSQKKARDAAWAKTKSQPSGKLAKNAARSADSSARSAALAKSLGGRAGKGSAPAKKVGASTVKPVHVAPAAKAAKSINTARKKSGATVIPVDVTPSAPKKANRWDEVQARTLAKLAAGKGGRNGIDAMDRLRTQRLRDQRRG